MKKLGFMILGLLAHSIAYAKAYDCGRLPGVETRVFINDGGWPSQQQNPHMGVKWVVGAETVLEDWFPASAEGNILQAEIPVGTGTYYLLNLKKESNRTSLQIIEVYYSPQADGTVKPEFTSFPEQSCRPL